MTSLMNDCKEKNIDIEIGLKNYDPQKVKPFGKSPFLSVSFPKPSLKNPDTMLQIQSKLLELKTMVESLGEGNPMLQIKSKLKELETGFDTWLSKQPLYIMAAVSTAHGAAHGAYVGVILQSMQVLYKHVFRTNEEFKRSQFKRVGKYTAAYGAYAGISTVLMRLKGKEDVQSSMIAAFGSGAAYSLVVTMRRPHQVKLEYMVIFGFLFALVRGGTYKLGEKFFIPDEDPSFMKTEGISKYMGLVKKELLDSFSLYNYRGLRGVKIPPRP